MNDPRPINPRERLKALLAIPERQRTDEEWDELIQIEITLAPGNREGAPNIPQNIHQPRGHQQNQNQRGGGGQQPGQRGGPQQPGKKPGKKFHRRPQKRNGP
jgi:hypothetical protein